ncbi:MAG TPA: MFS transporter [Anaerolineaceae bacterium]|nr:MFS transporter [Anaerolineaceae bacterium]HPN50379.1 MFS transporter [Anaerolineaceae bacterium]
MKSFGTTGKNAFNILWAGQAVSLLGTGLTRFAVMIWAYQVEGSATALALLGFFACITFVVVSPFAGVLVDRWDRRKVMFLADLGAGVMTGMLLLLNLSDRLELWHLYLAEGLAGAFEAFQEPAFSAAISLLVPKEEYTRSNGLLGLGKSAARVLAPAFSGLLMQAGGLNSVMTVDMMTMGLALGGLALVRIPAPQRTQTGQQAQGNFWHELRFGFGYIFNRPGLRGILITYFNINLFGTLTYFAVLSPMILARTGGDEVTLGVVRTVMGLGGICGGLFISLRRAPWRKTRIFLWSTLLSFLICDFMTAVSRSVWGWSLAGFVSELTIPFIVSPYYALWQEQVPPDVQGRVFSTREMVQISSQPAGYLLGGLLADRLFEPLFQGPGMLTWLIGSGPGAGMAAMFLLTSLLGGLTGLTGLLSPAIRRLDAPAQESPLPALPEEAGQAVVFSDERVK